MTLLGRPIEEVKASLLGRWCGGDLREASKFLLHPDFPQLAEAGFTPDTTNYAREQLARIYSRRVVSAMMDAPGGVGLLAPIFLWMNPAAVVPLLRLGLAAALRFPGKKLRKRLRDPAAFDGAALEVEVGASLALLTDDQFEAEPLVGTAHPDFRFEHRGRRYLLEVKSPDAHGVERFGTRMNQDFAMAAVRFCLPNTRAEFRFKEEVRRGCLTEEGRGNFETMVYPALVREVVRLYRQFRKTCPAAGVHPIGEFGELEFARSAGPEGEVSFDLMPTWDHAMQAERVASVIIGAGKQLRGAPEDVVRIILIDIQDRTSPLAVKEALQESEKRSGRLFTGAEMVVLRTFKRNAIGPILWYGVPLGRRGFEVTSADLEVALLLGDFGLASPVDPEAGVGALASADRAP